MLASSKIGRSTSAAAFSLSRLLNDPSDLHRLAKARKLRELLKEEAHKERVSSDQPGCNSIGVTFTRMCDFNPVLIFCAVETQEVKVAVKGIYSRSCQDDHEGPYSLPARV